LKGENVEEDEPNPGRLASRVTTANDDDSKSESEESQDGKEAEEGTILH
jgi:hypothetical protein